MADAHVEAADRRFQRARREAEKIVRELAALGTSAVVDRKDWLDLLAHHLTVFAVDEVIRHHEEATARLYSKLEGRHGEQTEVQRVAGSTESGGTE